MSVLINFDGMAGSGKTTIVHLLKYFLLTKGRNVEIIREKHIPCFKNKLQDWKIKASNSLYSIEDIQSIAKERAKAHKLFILPLLQSGKIVFLDRCYFTCAAINATNEIPPKLIVETNLNEAVIKGKKSLIFVCPIETSLKRIMDRDILKPPKWPKKYSNIYEFLNCTYINYKSIIKTLNDKDVVEIDASLPIKEILHTVIIKTGFLEV